MGAIKIAIKIVLEALIFLPLFLLAILSRLSKKSIDVGLGPEPILSHAYHKQALELHGYSAETFVSSVYYISSAFDYRADLKFKWPLGFVRDF